MPLPYLHKHIINNEGKDMADAIMGDVPNSNAGDAACSRSLPSPAKQYPETVGGFVDFLIDSAGELSIVREWLIAGYIAFNRREGGPMEGKP